MKQPTHITEEDIFSRIKPIYFQSGFGCYDIDSYETTDGRHFQFSEQAIAHEKKLIANEIFTKEV